MDIELIDLIGMRLISFKSVREQKNYNRLTKNKYLFSFKKTINQILGKTKNADQTYIQLNVKYRVRTYLHIKSI